MSLWYDQEAIAHNGACLSCCWYGNVGSWPHRRNTRAHEETSALLKTICVFRYEGHQQGLLFLWHSALTETSEHTPEPEYNKGTLAFFLALSLGPATHTSEILSQSPLMKQWFRALEQSGWKGGTGVFIRIEILMASKTSGSGKPVSLETNLKVPDLAR